MAEPWQHREITANGLKFHCVTAGEKGPLMLLLHGFPQDWYCWRHVIPELAKKFRVVVPDQRGYGGSDRPPKVRDYRVDALVEDVVGLIEAFGEKKAIVVAHDWGAAVAWALANQHPERVEKLVIINVPHPALMVRALKTNFRQMRRSWYIFFFQLPWLPERFVTGRGAANVARAMRGMAIRKEAFPPEDLDHYKKAMLMPGAARAAVNWYRAAARFPPRVVNRGRIEPPTLMIWGEQDTALGKELTYGTDKYCTGGLRIEYVKDCSHWVAEERPEDVARWVAEFATEAKA